MELKALLLVLGLGGCSIGLASTTLDERYVYYFFLSLQPIVMTIIGFLVKQWMENIRQEMLELKNETRTLRTSVEKHADKIVRVDERTQLLLAGRIIATPPPPVVHPP